MSLEINQLRMKIMRQKLAEALRPTLLEISDESLLHIGHAGAKSGAGHFALRIKADCFAGQSKIAIHRMIYAALDNMIPAEIHALRIIIAA